MNFNRPTATVTATVRTPGQFIDRGYTLTEIGGHGAEYQPDEDHHGETKRADLPLSQRGWWSCMAA